ncbi:hypothetical protein [Burkholderia sp. NRF60-BP8]|uniref:hypothetical protein n=1 Tax=Burkholderia sp. NRF60-BP8 TaxID=1637853 RepID=UPI0013967694|nr:hypothetical protein [Burkholderia sp. NRF60-BP8]
MDHILVIFVSEHWYALILGRNFNLVASERRIFVRLSAIDTTNRDEAHHCRYTAQPLIIGHHPFERLQLFKQSAHRVMPAVLPGLLPYR